MIKTIGICLLTVSLTGCACFKEPKERIVLHNVEIPIPCKITAPEKPVMPLTDTVTKADNLFVQAKKALAEIDFRISYESKLEAAIKACQ